MARYEENKGWRSLLAATYFIWNRDEVSQSYQSYTIMHKPLSLNHAGSYAYSSGYPSRNGTNSRIWHKGLVKASHARTVYYNITSMFYAGAQSYKGFGSSIRCVAKFGDATDSICPKGWEMARREKNKSYNGLLSNNYGKSIFGSLKGANEADQGIKSNPLSLVRSGYFQCLNGNFAVRGSNYGNVWTSEIRNAGVSYNFTFYPYGILGGEHTDRKGDGYSVCWGAKIKLQQ